MKSEGSRILSRRAFLKNTAALAAVTGLSHLPGLASASKSTHIAVIGAGAFGGWTALHLLRQKVRVTLVDAWGPGNARASSGGETRVIRATYGRNGVYTKMAVRALQLWQENEKRWNRKLYTRTGALWMVMGSEEFEKTSLPHLDEAGLPYEQISTKEAELRYPQVNFEGVSWVLIEKEAGFLLARQACQVVHEAFLAEGGEYKQASVAPRPMENRRMAGIALSDGSTLTADQYIFACGPWLGKIFPDILGSLIQPTRQEAFFFGTPPGDHRFDEQHLPVWIHHGSALFYGIPGNQYRGLKVADDTHGPAFDPTTGERIVTSENLQAARAILELRFPAMKGAPLLESRVCQYENSPDSNFIIDRHPAAENVWFVGGGSGHGYKHGPALGEYVADVVLGNKTPDPFFMLSRFSK